MVIVSCSKNDSDSGANSDFHPPKWIQGVWVIQSETSNPRTDEVVWTFTSNDFCYITTQDNMSHCQQDFANYSNKSGFKTTITETITETSYIVKYDTPRSGHTGYNTFKKISDTIQWRDAELYVKVD